MKGFLKWLVTASISLALVIPLVPVLLALVGGGFIGGLACLVLGSVTYWAVGTVLSTAVEGFRRTRQKKTRMVDSKYGTSYRR